MFSDLSSPVPAIFSIHCEGGVVRFEPGKLYWCPVADAEEGERVLDALDGAATPPRDTLFYEGRDLAAFSRRDWLNYLAHTSFLTPSGDLISNLSVMENLLVTSSPAGGIHSKELMDKISAEIAEELFANTRDPEAFLLSLPYQLCLLDRARVGILRAMVRKAGWLVRTDEPPGLEPSARNEYARLLLALRNFLPEAPWLFVCVQSELPDSWGDFQLIESFQP